MDMDDKVHVGDSDAEKGSLRSPISNQTGTDAVYDGTVAGAHYEGKPTQEELDTLRRVSGPMPAIAYLICIVEFCERASYYGIYNIISNYFNRPLPPGGNGYGSPPRGSQETGGALGLGQAKATAFQQSFQMLAYVLPMFFGYLADTRIGRFNMIFYGVFVFGIAHVLMMAGASKELLANGNAKIPFLLGWYILAVGSAMFKPCVSPLLLDQMKTQVPKVKTLKTGEKVIEDPEATTERVMLWFYLLINIGGFMGTATSYAEKYIGWWLAFLLPLLLYLPLPLLLWWLKPRMILLPPGGNDLPNVFRVLGYCMRGGGIFRIGRSGWWDPAKPSVIASKGGSETRWNDQFIEDVKRTFQATGIFCFFPVQNWNDNGIANSESYLSTILTSNGVPNDLIVNMNSLAIIAGGPVLQYGLYPLLAKMRIRYGPVARMSTGFFIASLGGMGYAILQWRAYATGPCGAYTSIDPKCLDNGLVSPISLWWTAIPVAVGGFSELFCNVPAYGIAYSRAPVNMRGLVSAINLLNSGVAYAINLAVSDAVVDPHLVWAFGAVAILGAVTTVVFYFMFRHIDKEEYVLSTNAPELHTSMGTTHTFMEENELNHTSNKPAAPIEVNEMYPISQKQ